MVHTKQTIPLIERHISPMSVPPVSPSAEGFCQVILSVLLFLYKLFPLL